MEKTKRAWPEEGSPENASYRESAIRKKTLAATVTPLRRERDSDWRLRMSRTKAPSQGPGPKRRKVLPKSLAAEGQKACRAADDKPKENDCPRLTKGGWRHSV